MENSLEQYIAKSSELLVDINAELDEQDIFIAKIKNRYLLSKGTALESDYAELLRKANVQKKKLLSLKMNVKVRLAIKRLFN
ncbi:MAG: hypothetical protein IKD75_04810 [Prevotella sp.]|nr:hypothetical protein [Prevotella sp.]